VRPAVRQSRGVWRESPGGRLWRSAGLWDGPETLRDASEPVYTKEPMVDVGAWDIGGAGEQRGGTAPPLTRS